MNAPVDIEDIVTAFEIVIEGAAYYLDRGTGAVRVVADEDHLAALAGNPPEKYPAARQDEMRIAHDLIADPDRFVPIIPPDEALEWNMMLFFARDQRDEGIRRELLEGLAQNAVQFRGRVAEFDMSTEWRAYQKRVLRKAAEAWCRENGVEVRVPNGDFLPS